MWLDYTLVHLSQADEKWAVQIFDLKKFKQEMAVEKLQKNSKYTNQE